MDNRPQQQPVGANPLPDLSEYSVYQTDYWYDYTDWLTGAKKTIKFQIPQKRKLS